MNELQVAFPNVLHIQCIEMQELMTVQTIRSAPSLQLPRTLTSHKDTHGFLELMLSKIDLVHRALNYTDASHLAWIDFNIAHVFSGDKPLYALFALQHRRHLRLDGLLMPRIWERGTNMDGDSLRNKVNWRFAGGFFLGDRASLGRWYELQSDSLRLFLEETHTLVWEVNFWAWMEQTYPHSFHPHVYISDHDNSLVQVPPDWDEE